MKSSELPFIVEVMMGQGRCHEESFLVRAPHLFIQRPQSDTTSEISCLCFRILGVMNFHNIPVVRGSFTNCVGPRNMPVYLWLEGRVQTLLKGG
jgi:hypothetical protein